ncbi:MAG TPA: two-component regulator propeller domain-containing protein, partial [Bacteroidales bacterium]|nr:two-component regulator propeller domain-containing protein [Bacteroidales bacterium]
MKQSGSFPALSLLAAVCLQLCCISSTLAQPQLFFDRFLSENIRVERGLSQNTVYTLLQDTDGFLWMGTWDGLNKFDGYNFTTYNKENGLTNEAIRALYQHGDVIWVGTESGLNAISLKDGSVKQFFAQGDTASLSDNWINHITADHRGMLWISTARGLTELDP